jgi:tripeptide aminopeptidase
VSKLPLNEVPESTEGYEGFFHLHQFTGNVEKTTLNFIIRDHDRVLFEDRKQFMLDLVDKMNNELGFNAIEIDIKDQYYNMKEKVVPVMHIVDIAEEVMNDIGITPLIKPIRGGTDGSQLSFMGLPCPNIFAGGHNFHGRYEYVPVESMMKATEVIIGISEKVALKFKN